MRIAVARSCQTTGAEIWGDMTVVDRKYLPVNWNGRLPFHDPRLVRGPARSGSVGRPKWDDHRGRDGRGLGPFRSRLLPFVGSRAT